MTLRIPAGYIATVFSANDNAGEYWEIAVSNARPGPLVSVAVGASAVIGPFAVDKHYEVRNLVVMLASEAPFEPSLEANVPAVVDSGELVAVPNTIAAVNAILDILVANGLMAAEE